MLKSAVKKQLYLLISAWMLFLTVHKGQSEGNPWNTNCPMGCTCALRQSAHVEPNKNLYRTVDCASRKLKAIPKDIPPNVEVLLLQRNVIGSILDELANWTMLKEIDLSYNEIPSLGPHSIFQNMSVLQYLDLSSNTLQTLPHGMFGGLRSLNTLLLAYNDIDLIEQYAFGGLNHLEKLTLEGNKLVNVKADWFENLSDLNILHLADNNIHDIENNAFEFLTTLNELSLAGNKLQSNLNKFTFRGLEKLKTLKLDKNNLSDIPTRALQTFQRLQFLSLDRNPVYQLRPGAFKTLKITELSLCSMDTLLLVEQEAFSNLQDLVILQMHSNRKLSYLDPGAFINVPKLQRLYLHSNNLNAVSSELTQRLPSLELISFNHNPMHCDCNAYWIKQLISYAPNTTNMYGRVKFTDTDKLICDTPLSMSNRPLRQIPIFRIHHECAPTIVKYFNDSYQRELGDSITFACRAIGVPHPHIHWILSNGKAVNNTSNYSRFRLELIGTLTVEHIKAGDAGTFTCIATNSMGYDTSSTILQVHSKNIHILHKGIATNFITVTWNGTDSTVFTSDYVILYKRQGSDEEYGRIHLRPYMRTYTITNLQPETVYEFCIAYEHKNDIVKLNCLDIETKHEMFVMEGVKTLGSMTILIALVICLSSITFLCVSVALVKRYRRRKAYKEPEEVNYKVDTMSHIPLDNLYNPPSTPLCTSRTTLISGGSTTA